MSEPYEIIDPDPHFLRVIRYFRPSDYGAWAVATAAFPGLFTLFEYLDPVDRVRFNRPHPSYLRLTTLLGFCGGFIIAYNRSSKRFHGIDENLREVQKDRFEVKRNLSQGLPPLGYKPSLNPWMQELTFRNSKNSQHALFLMPWFSFFHHEFHGVDLKKYYEVRPGEESWNFKLPDIDTLEKKSF